MAVFMWGRWRHDLVALAALLACILLGLVPGRRGFYAGFEQPASSRRLRAEFSARIINQRPPSTGSPATAHARQHAGTGRECRDCALWAGGWAFFFHRRAGASHETMVGALA